MDFLDIISSYFFLSSLDNLPLTSRATLLYFIVFQRGFLLTINPLSLETFIFPDIEI